MQLERDSLQKHIIPDLNMRLADYGTKISQTDLRWGISTAELSPEEGEQKVLNVCLDEINKSRPYMIVMLGDRYGWVPSSALVEMTAKGREIHLLNKEISVTQLEIEYIAFTEKWDESRIFFYFRDFDYGDMPKEQRAIYDTENESDKAKLRELRERIEKKFPTQINRYSLRYENGEVYGIEEFERLVIEDLYNLFLHDAKEDEKIDINERVRTKLHYEAKEAFPNYVWNYDISRGKGTDIATRDIPASELTHIYISGPPRSGKSLSVLSYYMSVFAYQHRDDSSWKIAEPYFEIHNSFFQADGIYSKLPSTIDMDSTFPLYLQLGNCKDIYTSADLWRTTLYFLNQHLGIKADIPTEKKDILDGLIDSIRSLADSDKTFFLFVDDLTPEALDDMFTIEHAFDEDEVPKILSSFFFYASFNNQFSQVPVYVPFYNHCSIRVYSDDLSIPDEYFFAYAKKLGKELSKGVVDYIIGYYGGYGKTYEDASFRHLTRPLVNLMANYFMNFTTSDYREIKRMGNDMKAIEAQNLALLKPLDGDFSEDMSGKTLERVALMNVEKFEANHSVTTLKMMGIIYLLSGASFSYEEAKEIYAYFGERWSDLDYISYFDDFKEFFVYNKDEDSYRVIPMFHSILREHLIKTYLSDTAEIEASVEKLISAVMSSDFYDTSRDELIYTTLLVPSTDFVLRILSRLKSSDDFDYDIGKRLGQALRQLLKTTKEGDVARIGEVLSPILSSHFSSEALSGFLSGIGGGFQDHEYERKIMELVDAIISCEPDVSGEVGATLMLGIYLLRAYCYLGFKDDKTLDILTEAEVYAAGACDDIRVRYLSILSIMLRKFDKGSPVFDRLAEMILRYLPEKSPLSYDNERDIAISADMYTVAYFVKELGVADDFYDPEELLSPFLNRDSFHELGLYNIETAIYAQDAKLIGMDELVLRTRMFMESLAVHFPSDNFAKRLIGKALLARMFNVPGVVPKEEQPKEYEKYFYPYRKAVLHSTDNTGYHFINYALMLQNARFFHITTGITRGMDEMMWEATNMSSWTSFYMKCNEESLDVLIAVAWVYYAYLRDPDFHDMISTKGYDDTVYGEPDAVEPSIRAIHYRFTKTLCAVLHNPKSLIMKPKLKRELKGIQDRYSDYLGSLASKQYKALVKYIETL